MAMFIGRLTKDSEIKTLNDGHEVLNFTVAVNDFYKPKNGEDLVKEVTYFNCAYWINPKIKDRLKKAVVAEVHGRIYARAYKDSNGKPKSSIHCHVSQIKIHTTSKGGDVPSNTKKVVKEVPTEVMDNLPF